MKSNNKRIAELRIGDADKQQVSEQGNFRAWGQYSMVQDSHCGSNGALALHQPYRLVEGRLMKVLEGRIRSTSNLMEHEMKAGDLLLLPPDCIIELIEMSNDARLQILSYSDDAFSVKNHDVILVAPQGEEREQVDMMITLIWLSLGRQPVVQGVVEHLFQSLQLLIIGIDEKKKVDSAEEEESHRHQLFQRFLTLVYAHCTRERTLVFYANKLFITPHYLSTMVKQVSNVNATTWINRAVCLEAKVRLRHSQLLIGQISDELNFPNPAFFNKFFKREMGITPKEYRDGREC